MEIQRKKDNAAALAHTAEGLRPCWVRLVQLRVSQPKHQATTATSIVTSNNAHSSAAQEPGKNRNGADDRRFKCSRCDKAFQRSEHRKLHESGIHDKEKHYRCTYDGCDRTFSSLSNKYRHERTHLRMEHDCKICSRRFRHAQSLIAHARIHMSTPKKTYSCTFCDKVCTSRQGLHAHVRHHIGEKPAACPDCGRRFYTTQQLTVHKNKYHLNVSLKVHTCDICNQQLSRALTLRNHQARFHGIGINPYRYSCAECSKLFKTRSELTRHQVTHSVLKTISCPFCPAAFKHRGGMKLHVQRRHTGEKPDICPVPGCDARFKGQYYLTKHNERVHLLKKPHACPHCTKMFADKANLVCHIRIHTGEKPYACGTCDKKFIASNNLKRHFMTHIGEQPYACMDCGKWYKHQVTLKQHLRVSHHTDSP